MKSTTNNYGMNDEFFRQQYDFYSVAIDNLPTDTPIQIARQKHCYRLLESAPINSSAFGYIDEILMADFSDKNKFDTSPMMQTDTYHTASIDEVTRKRAYEHKHNYTDFKEYLFDVVKNEKGKVLSYKFRKKFSNRYIIYYNDMKNSATNKERRVLEPRVLPMEEFIALVFSFGALRCRSKKDRYGNQIYGEPVYQGNSAKVYKALLNYPIFTPDIYKEN